jgi:hypothetical protein
MSNLNALIIANRYRKHDGVNSHPVETTVAFLVVFAFGFGVGYFVREQVSRARRRRYSERNQP